MVAGPTVPLPPALLSMAIGCPSTLEALSAIARIEISVEPPAGHGTISVIGLVGYSCAPAAADISMPTAATAIVKRLRRTYQILPDGLFDGEARLSSFPRARSSPKSIEKKSLLTAARRCRGGSQSAGNVPCDNWSAAASRDTELCRALQCKGGCLVGLRLAIDHIGRQPRTAAGDARQPSRAWRQAASAATNISASPCRLRWRPRDWRIGGRPGHRSGG